MILWLVSIKLYIYKKSYKLVQINFVNLRFDGGFDCISEQEKLSEVSNDIFSKSDYWAHSDINWDIEGCSYVVY